MDLVASLVNSLAWPVSTAVIVVVLRRSILTFMGRIGAQIPRATKVSMDAGPWKFAMEMAERIREEQNAEPASADREIQGAAEEFESEVNRVLAMSPAAAVVLSWSRVKTALESAYVRSGLESSYEPSTIFTNSWTMTQRLESAGLISPTVAKGLQISIELTNRARRGVDNITADEAAAVIPLAVELIHVLTEIPATANSD